MERIKLTKEEKQVLRLVEHYEQCPSAYSPNMFRFCVYTLEQKGLVNAIWSTGHELAGAKLTYLGKAYMTVNPKLRNPIDWELIAPVIASASLALAIVALLIVC